MYWNGCSRSTKHVALGWIVTLDVLKLKTPFITKGRFSWIVTLDVLKSRHI